MLRRLWLWLVGQVILFRSDERTLSESMAPRWILRTLDRDGFRLVRPIRVDETDTPLVIKVGVEGFDQAPEMPALRWFSTDTAVARLEVSADGRSAQVTIVGAGHCDIVVSDEVSFVSQRLWVEQPQPAVKQVLGVSLS